MAKKADGLFSTVYRVQCTVYNIQCAVYIVHCTLYSVLYTVQFIVQCTVYIVQYTDYIVELSLIRLEEEVRTKPQVDNQDNRSAAEVDSDLKS